MYNHAPENYDCPLCSISKGVETEHNKLQDIVYKDEKVMAHISPKWWPNNAAPVIIYPRKHFENIYDIPDELLADIYKVGKKIALSMKESYPCDGTSFRQHNEPSGNQSVFHFHLQVLPRYKGDNLYLNHENARWVSAEERKPYAEKMRGK